MRSLRDHIKEHRLLDEALMNLDVGEPKSSDRSAFRKNIGRTLLNKDGDSYLDV